MSNPTALADDTVREFVTGPTGNVAASVTFRGPNADPSSIMGNIYGRYVALCLAQRGGRWHIQGQNRHNSNETLCGEILTGGKSRLDISVALIECGRCMDLGGNGFLYYPHIETPAGLSVPQRRLFESARDFGRFTDQGGLVSGHEYRTALSLERKGLGTVRYQGRSMGWYTVVPTPVQVPATSPRPISNLAGATR